MVTFCLYGGDRITNQGLEYLKNQNMIKLYQFKLNEKGTSCLKNVNSICLIECKMTDKCL